MVVNEDRDSRLFAKADKENKSEAVPFVFAFKKKAITKLCFCFCFVFFTSVICDPFACSAKIFWLFYSGKPVGG